MLKKFILHFFLSYLINTFLKEICPHGNNLYVERQGLAENEKCNYTKKNQSWSL
jgi:hypothetical protein